MKKIMMVLFMIFSIKFTLSQSIQPIVVTSQSISIPGVLTVGAWKNEHANQSYPGYPKLLFGFAEGDDIIIDFTTENKKGTQLIEVTDYESQSIVYSNKEFQTLDGVRIKVSKTAVYQFEFATNHMFDRQCKVIIKRQPATEATKNFNCNITWKTINDTTFVNEEQKIKVSSKYETVSLQTPINHFINSGSNADFKTGKSRIAFPITLPENTVEWYYIFSATRDKSAVEATKAQMHLFSELSNLIDKSGLVGIGLDVITEPPGADYGDIYLLNPENIQYFLNKQDDLWKYMSDGTRENIMSGKVRIKDCCTVGRYFIGLRNPDYEYGLHIMIEVVAIVENAKYEIRQIRKPISIVSKKVPIYGN